MQDIHDLVFRAAMDDIRVARDFIHQCYKTFIPCIDLTTLQICKDIYVNKVTRKKLLADVIYKACWSNTEDWLYFLIEAQAKPDYSMAWRIRQYTDQIIAYHVPHPLLSSADLPIVLPLVYYHGQRRYHSPCNILALFGRYKKIAKDYILDRYQLFILYQLTDAEILKTGYAALLLGIMKYIHAKDFLASAEYLLIILLKRFDQQDTQDYLYLMLKYALDVAKIPNKEKFFNLIATYLAKPMRSKMMTIAEQLRREGMREGESALFIRLLKRKFAILPKKYLAMIKTADEKKLFQWGENILFADKVEEVFS